MNNICKLYCDKRVRSTWASVWLVASLKSFILGQTGGVEDYRTIAIGYDYSLISIPVVPEISLAVEEDVLRFNRSFQEDVVVMERYRVAVNSQCYLDGTYEINVGYGKLSNTVVYWVSDVAPLYDRENENRQGG